MPMLRGYKPYDRKVECQVCGQKWRFSDMHRGVFGSQKGLEVCPKCLDPVHPSEAPIRSRPEEGKLDKVE